MCTVFKKLISRLPRRALTNIDILKYTRDIPYFRGVYMRDNLPNNPNNVECAILNLDISINDGTHWVAYVKVKKYAQYFDSYGLKPPMELINYLTMKTILFYNYENCQKNNPYNCGHLSIKFLNNFWKKHLN